MSTSDNKMEFRCYSVLKNEDAPPYLGENLLVAADGLGGSGSSVHKIDIRRHPDMRGEILKCAFGDFEDEAAISALAPYIDELVEAMADGEDDTSALWASRIVIARFVYALMTEEKYSYANIKKEENLASLVKFIREGLYSTARHFALEAGRISGQILLPTTLAAIRTEESGDFVLAEVMWAGDSRAYAITKDGLKLLSRDDEDGSGSITNIFDGREEKDTRMNYRVYKLQKPCVLMALSDGIFDPFAPNDNLGVENVFLNLIAASENLEEVKEKLVTYFDKVHGDDASVSFRAYGFGTFAEMKSAFAERLALINEVSLKNEEMKNFMAALESSEEDVSSYIRQRSIDKYAKIAETLIDGLSRGEDDILFRTGYIHRKTEEKKRSLEEAALRARQDRQAKAIRDCTEVLVSMDCGIREAVINSGVSPEESLMLEKVAAAQAVFIEEKKKLEEKIQKYRENEEIRAAIKGEIQKIIRRLSEEIEKISNAGYTFKFEEKYAAYVKCFELSSLRDFFIRILIKIDFEVQIERPPRVKRLKNSLFDKGERRTLNFSEIPTYYPVGLSEEEVRLLNAVNLNLKSAPTLRHLVFIQNNKVESCHKRFEYLAAKLIETVMEKGNPKEFFVPEIRDMLLSFSEGESEQTAKTALTPILEEILKSEKSAVVDAIVEAFKNNPDEKSIIDACYNSTRLAAFRDYYKAKNADRGPVLEFMDKLAGINKAYFDLPEEI